MNGMEEHEPKEGVAEAGPETTIAQAESFDELFQALQSVEEIKESNGRFITRERLIEKIENLRESLREIKKTYPDVSGALAIGLKEITRTFGLRQKTQKPLER